MPEYIYISLIYEFSKSFLTSQRFQPASCRIRSHWSSANLVETGNLSRMGIQSDFSLLFEDLLFLYSWLGLLFEHFEVWSKFDSTRFFLEFENFSDCDVQTWEQFFFILKNFPASTGLYRKRLKLLEYFLFPQENTQLSACLGLL